MSDLCGRLTPEIGHGDDDRVCRNWIVPPTGGL